VGAALVHSGREAGDVIATELHATGTALGDPIEVGAVVRIQLRSLRRRRHQPQSLRASKSQVGHTEASAGATGVQQSLRMLETKQETAILHLHALNHYVVQALTLPRSTKQTTNANRVLSRRSAGALAVVSSSLVGASAFGLSGTNAHALLASAVDCDGVLLPASPIVVWHREHAQATPWAHALLAAASADPRKEEVVLQADLQTAACEYLWDHVFDGTAILSEASLLELGMSAGVLVCGELSMELAITAVAMPSAFNLAEHAKAPRDDQLLQCTVAGSGDVLMHSVGSAATLQRHLLGCFVHATQTFSDSAGDIHYGSAQAGAAREPQTLILLFTRSSSSPSSAVTQHASPSRGNVDTERIHITSGYRIHPAQHSAGIQAGLAAQTQKAVPRMTAALDAFRAPQQLRYRCHLSAASVASRQDPHDVSRDVQLHGAGGFSMQIKRLLAKAVLLTSMARRSLHRRSVYAALWQAATVSLPRPTVDRPAVSLQSSGMPTASSSRLPMQGMPVVVYSAASWTTGPRALEGHCSRLLETIQCTPSLGAEKLLLQTWGEITDRTSPVAYGASVIVMSALQSLMRNAGTEGHGGFIQAADVSATAGFRRAEMGNEEPLLRLWQQRILAEHARGGCESGLVAQGGQKPGVAHRA